MVTPINNDHPIIFTGDVGAAKANPGSKAQGAIKDSIPSNPYSESIDRWQKEKADLTEKLNTLIDEKDALKKAYPDAPWYKQIGITAELGVKAVQILFTSAQIERLTAKIKEYS